jgi:PIN domain nuclease of toxin-antitoxin system
LVWWSSRSQPRRPRSRPAFWEKTRGLGLSLADRACLALAIERGAAVLTADRTWAELDLGIEIRLVRHS